MLLEKLEQKKREMERGEMECGRNSSLRHIYKGSEHLLLAKIEADALVTEGLNALTKADRIEGEVLEWERSGEGPGMRDRKRVIIERLEGMGDRKARRR